MQLHYERVFKAENQLPVQAECDVLVVGGGCSGISAAVAAARRGAKTILLERNFLLGGDALAGGISWLSYFNLYHSFNTQPRQLVYGIAYEIASRLVEMGVTPGFYEDTAIWAQESRGIHADRERLKAFFQAFLSESGVEIRYGALAADAVMDGSDVKGVVVQDGSRRYAILAGMVVDASGDGDIACHAGANCREYEVHGVGMAFGVSDVDLEKAADYGRGYNALTHAAYGTQGEMKGKLVKYGLRTNYVPGLTPPQKASEIHSSFCIETVYDGEAPYINGVNTPGSKTIDPVEATDTILRLRENIVKSVAFLNEYIPGFEKARLSWTTPIAGARQTRYVECHYDIPASDILGGVIHTDSIGLFGSQDAHYAGYLIKDGGWYGIPYRALIPKFVGNLFAVGRMLSSHWISYMSTRLTIACFIEGQAAGTAAAMALQAGCRPAELDTGELRRALVQDGVYLG
jgi:hypothetical protein